MCRASVWPARAKISLRHQGVPAPRRPAHSPPASGPAVRPQAEGPFRGEQPSRWDEPNALRSRPAGRPFPACGGLSVLAGARGEQGWLRPGFPVSHNRLDSGREAAVKEIVGTAYERWDAGDHDGLLSMFPTVR